MAAHARRLAQQQAFQPIRLPSGDPAPVMHQHADDTSIHARSTRDAQVILDTSVDCAATGSKLQRGKSQGLELKPPCPQADAGGVQGTLVPPGRPLRAGRGAGCAAPHPLERAPPGAAARMTLAT
ncbi:g1690 [Coccomyxa elongata]